MTTFMTMPSVSKATLKAHLLAYLRDVERTGDPVIVTSYGHPVARITRITSGDTVDALFGDVRGTLAFHEAPDAPTTDEWEHP